MRVNLEVDSVWIAKEHFIESSHQALLSDSFDSGDFLQIRIEVVLICQDLAPIETCFRAERCALLFEAIDDGGLDRLNFLLGWVPRGLETGEELVDAVLEVVGVF